MAPGYYRKEGDAKWTRFNAGTNSVEHSWTDKETGLNFTSIHIERRKFNPTDQIQIMFYGSNEVALGGVENLMGGGIKGFTFENIVYEFAHMEKDKLPK